MFSTGESVREFPGGKIDTLGNIQKGVETRGCRYLLQNTAVTYSTIEIFIKSVISVMYL